MTHKLKDVKDLSDKKKTKKRMVNITINIPDIYDENIQKLIRVKVVPSRSEAIRTALREFFQNEYKTMQLLGFFGDDKSEKKNTGRIFGKQTKTVIEDLKNKIERKDHMIDYLKSELEKHEKKGEKNHNTK